MAKYTRGSDGRFTAQVWDGTYRNGKKHYIKIRSDKSSRDLELKVENFKIKKATGAIVLSQDTSIYDYAVEWLKRAKSNVEGNTQAMYRNIIEKHLYDLQYVPFSALNHSLVMSLVSRTADRPRTCQQLIMTLKQICRSAERDKLLPRGETFDIFTDIKPPRHVAKEKRPLTPEETETLSYAPLTSRQKAFVYILFYCGLRREEALALTVFDLNFKDGTININKALAFDGNNPYIKVPKSRNSYRTLPLPAELTEVLQPYVSTLDSTNLFEKSSGGLMTHSAYVKMWSSIKNTLKQAYLSHSGVKMPNWSVVGFEDLTAHIFRHNYCTKLCYAMLEGHTLTTKKIAALLGDDERMVLNVYSHIIESKEKPLEAIESVLTLKAK